MAEVHPLDEYKVMVYPVLLSKVEEFKILGYDKVSTEEIWKCLTAKKWRKKEEKRIHEVVEDILSLKINDYMNFLSMQAFKSDDWFANEFAKSND